MPTEFQVSREFKNNSFAVQEDKVSLTTSGDWNTGRAHKSLEYYSSECDKLLLEAENVGNVYEHLSKSNIDQVLDFRSDLSKGMASAMTTLMSSYKNAGYKTGNIFKEFQKTGMLHSEAEVSKDPEKLRNEARARLAYCNALVATLQEVLRINNKALDLSLSEAKALSDALGGDDKDRSEAIKAIKSAILNNEAKFKTDYGFDFKSIGGGIVLTQLEGTGQIAGDMSSEKLVQYAYSYDAVVFSHGSAVKKDKVELFDKASKLMNELQKELTGLSSRKTSDIQEYLGKVETLCRYIFSSSLGEEEQAELVKTFNTKMVPILDRLREKMTQVQSAASDRAAAQMDKLMPSIQKIQEMGESSTWKEGIDSKRNKTWAMGEVSTPWGKKYTEIVPLCVDLIAHGYKKIKLISCNPGKYDLRKIKELNNKDGVVISFAMSSIAVVESSTAKHFTDTSLNEGFKESAKNVWMKIKNGIKIAWEKIKKAFRWLAKKAAELGRKFIGFIRKVKDKFSKSKKTHHVSIDPKTGHVSKAVTNNTAEACTKQAQNIANTGQVIEQIVKVQDVAFTQYMKLIDTLVAEGEALLKETANDIVSAAEKILEHTHLCSLTGGIDTSDEPISVDYLRDFPSFA